MRRWLVLLFTIVVHVLPLTSQPVVISTAETRPYSRENGKGYYDLLLSEAFHRVGLELEILHLPSDRSLADAAAGVTHGEFARIGGMEKQYPDLVRVPEKLADFSFSAFALRHGISLLDCSSLADYHVAYINGWKIYEERSRIVKSVTMVPGEEELFRVLLEGRVDLALYSRERGLDYLQRQGIQGIFPVEPPMSVQPMYLYLHSSMAHLVPALNEALKSMKVDGFTGKLAREVFGQ